MANRTQGSERRPATPGRFQGLKMRWSGGRDLNSRSPGPKPDPSAYRIRLDLSATYGNQRKSLNSKALLDNEQHASVANDWNPSQANRGSARRPKRSLICRPKGNTSGHSRIGIMAVSVGRTAHSRQCSLRVPHTPCKMLVDQCVTTRKHMDLKRIRLPDDPRRRVYEADGMARGVLE